MNLSMPARILFEKIDERIDYYSKEMQDEVFSLYHDMPWTHEQRMLLRPAMREQLEHFTQSIFELFDNIGGVLPDEVLGYTILSEHETEAIRAEGFPERVALDISDGFAEYSNMWWDYLYEKHQETSDSST